ncbi:MAG: hypothetical protein AB8E82_12570 [Aureispira sp.]
MQDSYLIQLWKQDKKLAFLILLFILGQFFFSYKQIETLPFFNYAMYARPNASQNQVYTQYQLYNRSQQPINLNQYIAPTFLAYQLPYYAQLYQQQPIDAPLRQTIQNRFDHFPTLVKYLNQQLANDSTSLLHCQQWLKGKTEQNKLSFWKENYVWVKNNFVLLTKTLVY